MAGYLYVVYSLVTVFVCISCVCASTPKYISYNSSDLSYLSNGIQLPLQPSFERDPIISEIVQEALPHMEWMTRLYNHHGWKTRLSMLENSECRNHMVTYINNLNNGTSWAAKMHDASGRYSGQFFFGNDYWLGSHALCNELVDYQTNSDLTPFPVQFYVAKIRVHINEQLTPVTRQLNLGQCLPTSCSISDIHRLLVQEHSQNASLSIVGVRPVPDEYSLFNDYKLHIIGGAAAVALLLIVVATLFDSIRSHRQYEKSAVVNNNNNLEDAKTAEKQKKESASDNSLGICAKLLLCFSAVTNGKKILNVDPLSKESIRCIHGLRFFSIVWIIMVHTYLEVFAVADNKTYRTVTERFAMYQTVSNATFSVDTFFFISGLLVTISYFRSEAKKSGNRHNEEQQNTQGFITNALKFFTLIFYRFIRLTPAYMFVLGLNELAMRYYHSNSVFSPAIVDHISCTQYWWRNFLYINNFYPQHEFCMLWSWYMSNDMQFFIIAILLLIIGVRSEKHLKWVGGIILALLVASWITSFIVAIEYQYVVRIEEPFALFDQLYDKPWLRIGSYLVGMGTGYFLFRVDCKINLPKSVAFLFWLLSLSCLISLVYGIGRSGLVIPVSAFYAALGHTAWGLSLAWITIACCTGYGAPVEAFLSFRGILPFSRLTYCAYLVHPVLMCITSFQMDGPLHLHNGLVLIIFFGNVVASFLASFAISLGFEAPFVCLLRIMFPPAQKKR